MRLVDYSALLCALVGVLAYLNTMDCGLCFDDRRAVVKNQDLRQTTPWSNMLWNDFWGVPMASGDSHKSYRPLCVATFKLNYLLHELEPMGYHLVNILLHGVVCYLYVQLVSLVLSEVWPALIAGLLFAVHPIHTEAVAGVVGRADVMAGLFYLSSILIYHRATQARSAKGHHWLVFSLVLCVGSALSKETGLTAIASCLAMDYLLVQQLTVFDFPKIFSSPKGFKYRGFLTRLLLSLSFVVGFMYCRLKLMRSSPSFGYGLNPARYQPTPQRQLHWIYLTTLHYWLLLSPSRLAPEYAMHTIPLIHHLGDTRNLATLVMFLALATLITFALHRRSGVVLFGMSLLVFPYLPASNLFFPVGFVVAERILYLPSMGLCLLVAHGVWKLMKHSHKLTKALTIVGLSALLVVHTVKTVSRNRDWYNETTLYSGALKTYPNNAKMAHNLGVEYTKHPELTNQAIALMQLAMSAEPLYLSAVSDLGYLQQQNKQLGPAEETYKHGIELVYQALNGNYTISTDVKNLKMFTRYSKLLCQQHRHSTAEAMLRTVIDKLSSNTHYPSLWVELANVLLIKGGHAKEAQSVIDRALAQDPKHPGALAALARMYVSLGDKGRAERLLREAIDELGYKSPLVYELAATLQSHYHDNQDKLREAENLLKLLLHAQPTHTDTVTTLGLVYYQLKQYTEAHTMLLQAVNQSSNHTTALYGLGRLYVEVGQCVKARERLETILMLVPDHSKAIALLESCRQKLD